MGASRIGDWFLVGFQKATFRPHWKLVPAIDLERHFRPSVPWCFAVSEIAR